MGLFSGIGSFFGGPIGGLLGGIGDDLLGRNDAKSANNTAYAQQRQLRQTAYQDTTQDLRAAGLNPMLAYSNGATTAAGGPPVQNKGLSSAQQNSAQSTIANVNADTDNKKMTSALIEAQIAKTKAETPQVIQNTAESAQRVTNLQQDLKNLEENLEVLKSQKGLNIANTELAQQLKTVQTVQKALMESQISKQDAEAALTRVLTNLRRLDIPGATNSADFENRMGETLRAGGAAGTAAKAIGGIMELIKRIQK